MSMQKLYERLNQFDPYAIYRMALYKGVVISTIMVLVYWLFKPNSYIAFILPLFNLSLYEMPVLSKIKQKEKVILCVFAGMLVCSLTFYLLFPFRVLFLFYAILFFTVLYFLVQKYLSPLRNITMLIMATSAMFITVRPYGDLQIAYNIFFSSILSMTTIFLSLRLFHDTYLVNWLHAQQKYIESLEKDINYTLEISNTPFFIEEVNHINMVYSFRSLLRKKYLLHVYKLSFNIRNVQFALNTIYYQEKNEIFWQAVKKHLEKLRYNMRHKKIEPWSDGGLNPQTLIQRYTVNYLKLANHHWNKICAML